MIEYNEQRHPLDDIYPHAAYIDSVLTLGSKIRNGTTCIGRKHNSVIGQQRVFYHSTIDITTSNVIANLSFDVSEMKTISHCMCCIP